jgi:antirestriction protein
MQHFHLFCAFGRKVGAYELHHKTWAEVDENAETLLDIEDFVSGLEISINNEQWIIYPNIDNKDTTIAEVIKLYEHLKTLDEYQLKTLTARLLFDYPYSFADLWDATTNIDDCHFYEGMDLDDYVVEYIDNLGGVGELGIDLLSRYFDWDAFTRDIEIEQAGGIVRSSSGELLGYLEMYD